MKFYIFCTSSCFNYAATYVRNFNDTQKKKRKEIEKYYNLFPFRTT